MVGAHADEFLELLADLLRGAVDARGVGAFGVVINRGEPAMEFGARNLGALVHRHEDAFRNRKFLRVAAELGEFLFEDHHRPAEMGDRRAARAHPAVGELGRAAHRVRMADPHPDRHRLLHRLGRHRLAVEIVKAAVKGRFRLRPQRTDHRQFLAEAGQPALLGDLELAVMVLAAEPDAEDRPTVARIVEAGPLMRDHQRAVHRHDDDRAAEPDRRGDRGRVGQHHHRVEAEDVIQGIFSDPEVAKSQRFGALSDVPHRRDVDRFRRAMGQCHTKRYLVLQGHTPSLNADASFVPAHSGSPGTGQHPASLNSGLCAGCAG